MNRFGYKNPRIVSLYAERNNISVEEAEVLFDGMIEWLADSGEEKRTPSNKVDETWHWFILNTEAYADFCNQFLGSFVHHWPCGKGEKKEKEGEAICDAGGCRKYRAMEIPV